MERGRECMVWLVLAIVYISFFTNLTPDDAATFTILGSHLPLLLCSETVGEAIKWQTLSSSSVIEVYSLCSFSNIFLEGFACNTDLPRVELRLG